MDWDWDMDWTVMDSNSVDAGLFTSLRCCRRQTKLVCCDCLQKEIDDEEETLEEEETVEETIEEVYNNKSRHVSVLAALSLSVTLLLSVTITHCTRPLYGHYT